MRTTDTETEVDQVLTIRAWREPTGLDQAEWRGTVSHRNSDTRNHFVGIDRLIQVLRSLLD